MAVTRGGKETRWIDSSALRLVLTALASWYRYGPSTIVTCTADEP